MEERRIKHIYPDSSPLLVTTTRNWLGLEYIQDYVAEDKKKTLYFMSVFMYLTITEISIAYKNNLQNALKQMPSMSLISLFILVYIFKVSFSIPCRACPDGEYMCVATVYNIYLLVAFLRGIIQNNLK